MGGRVVIKSDASPWGPGSILIINSVIISWIASPLTEEDANIFGHELGDCSGQQTWECLVILVALRAWAPKWRHHRARLEFRGANVSALTMALSMKASGTGPNLVIGDAEFRPDVCSHVPGIANTTADILSRIFQPGKQQSFPQLLTGASETKVPVRKTEYFLTRDPAAPHRA